MMYGCTLVSDCCHKSFDMIWTFALGYTGTARLPGFHVCVGSGGERLVPDWYKEKGTVASFSRCQWMTECAPNICMNL